MSVIESLLDLPLRQASDNVCRICRKTFCCTKCRDRHVDKVHPDLNPNCDLCASETLPMRQFEKLLWENKKLLSHITDKHLPLHCVLCKNLFETVEDFKSAGACKWHSKYGQVLANVKFETPVPTSFEAKLKRIVNDLKYNSHTSFAQSEIYRNTSTPMFVNQKNGFEYHTPCAPNFSLKTPNSLLMTQSNTTSKSQQSQNSDIKFFSFSPNTVGNEETTPFRSSADEQFPRSNTGRKLDIKESNEIVYAEAQEVASYDDYTTSPVDMNLTNVQDSVFQEHTPKQNIGSREESGRASDVVKKVRFSDQYETLPEFGHPVKSTLNMTEDDDVFHDAHDESGVKNTKSAKSTQDTEDTKDVNIANDTNNSKDTENSEKKNIKEEDIEEKKIKNVEDAKDTKDDDQVDAKDTKDDDQVDAKDTKVDDQERSLVQSLKDSLNNTQVDISQENKQNAEKENQAVDALPNGVSTLTQKGNSRVLMMVLVENNSNSHDLMPLINSGLKKLEEQITLPSSSTSELSNVADTTGYTKRSTTKVEISVSSVESYSNNNNNAEMMTVHPQVEPVFLTSSVEDSQRSNNGGILSTLTQAVRLAFRNLSGVTSSNIESSQVVQRQQIVGNAMSLSEAGAQCLDNNPEVRYGKRARDINETPSRVGSVPLPLDIRSPLPKRKRGWYKIKGRRPIHSQVTSPRGVSSETQIFSQGSLTVGDTVLPLPARAYPEASLTPAE